MYRHLSLHCHDAVAHLARVVEKRLRHPRPVPRLRRKGKHTDRIRNDCFAYIYICSYLSIYMYVSELCATLGRFQACGEQQTTEQRVESTEGVSEIWF